MFQRSDRTGVNVVTMTTGQSETVECSIAGFIVERLLQVRVHKMNLITPPLSGKSYSWINKTYPKLTCLFSAFLVAFPLTSNAARTSTTIDPDGALVLKGDGLVINTNTNDLYTIDGTGEKVKISDFEEVRVFVTPTSDGGRGNTPWSFRLDAPETDLYIRIDAPDVDAAENSDAIHMTNWQPTINVRNFNAYVNAQKSDALNISREADRGSAKFQTFTAVVEHGNGMRANTSDLEGEATIFVEKGTNITINADSESDKVRNPTAVFAGSDETFGRTKGTANIDLNGTTLLTLNGAGNYGIWAGKNGSISVEDVVITSQGKNSYGIAANGNTLHNGIDIGSFKIDSQVLLDGQNYSIEMLGDGSRALAAEDSCGKILSANGGINTLHAIGNIEATSQGLVDITTNGRTDIVGAFTSQSRGTINWVAKGGLLISSKTEGDEFPTVIYAGDTSRFATGTDAITLSYGAASNITGDIVAIKNGQITISPIEGTTSRKDTATTMYLKGDVIAANGGKIDLKFGNGSHWVGRTDDYKDADSADWNETHSSIFTPSFSAPVTSSGSVSVNLGEGSTWTLTGQSWLSSLQGSNNVIDLTAEDGEGNHALHIGTITGSNNTFVMNLLRDGSGNMLYVYQGTSAPQNIVVANPEEALSMSVGEKIRFATIAQAGNGFEEGDVSGGSETALFGTRTTVADVGVFDVDYAIEYVDRASDDSSVDYDGGTDMTNEKPGSDYISSIYDDEENPDSQNVYLVRTGSSTISDAGQAIIATARGLYYNAIEIDRFNQRYGNRRYDENNKGLWARVRHDRWGTDAGVGDFKSQNTTYQIGFDYTDPVESGKMIYGAAVDLMDGNTDYESISGSGQTKRYAVSAYATYMKDNGGYLDIVGKIGRLSNEYSVRMDSGGVVTADYMNWMAGLSVEAGHQLSSETSCWFVEPQVQAQYVFVSDNDYSNGQTKVDQDSIHSFITRVGFRVGRWIGEDKGSNVYFKGDVLREWYGEQGIHVSDKTTGVGGDSFNLDNKGTWFDVGFGFQAPLGKSFYAYGDAEYRFGNDLDQTWTFNFGGKYVF